MFRILLVLSLISVFLFADMRDIKLNQKKEIDFNSLMNVTNVDQYKYLENNIKDVSEYQNSANMSNEERLVFLIKQAEKTWLKDTPEFKKLKVIAEKILNGGYKSTVFFFLYSDSMPIEHIIRFAQHITNIKKHDPNAEGYVVFRGVSGIDNTVKKLQEVVDSPFFDYSEVAKNIHVKLDPRFFQKLDAKKVPITILAECTNKHIFNNCEYKFVQKGSLSLVNFLNDVNFADPDNYGKYYNYVISPD